MKVCPNCKKEYSDNSNFCDVCGSALTVVDESVSSQPIQAENPMTVNEPIAETEPIAEAEPVNIYSNSENLIDQQATNYEKPKKSKKKLLAILLGAGIPIIAILVVVAILFSSTLISVNSSKNAPNSILYIKDDEMFYTPISKIKPNCITDNFYGDADDNSSYAYQNLNRSVISNDGNKLFYLDDIDIEKDDEDNVSEYKGATLYMRNPNKPDKEPKKIASEVINYHINLDCTVVTYTQKDGDEKKLYQYDLNKDEKDKLDDSVSDIYVSKDSKIVYFTQEKKKEVLKTSDYYDDDDDYQEDEYETEYKYNLYVKKSGEDKVKIADDINNIEYISDDFKTIYFKKDDNLYKSNEDGDKEKILSKINSILQIYDSGKIYFFRESNKKSDYLSFVNDDLKAKDDALADIERPEAPDYPWSSDYDDYDEWEKAYEAYEKKYERYEALLDKYYKRLDELEEKEERDKIREELKENYYCSIYELCFFDGKDIKVITDEYERRNVISDKEESPIIVYNILNTKKIKKVKFSDYANSYDAVEDIKDELNKKFEKAYEKYISIETNTQMLDYDISDIDYDSKDNKLYFTHDVNDNSSSKNYHQGDLYEISIKDSKIGEAKKLENNVYYEIYVDEKGNLQYFKNVDTQDDYSSGNGELYINSEKIDDDVYINGYDFTSNIEYLNDSDDFIYIVDYNKDKYNYTVKYYSNGKSKTIADDVYYYALTNKNELVYINDCNDDNEGDLYLSKLNDKEDTLIDEDVKSVIKAMSVEEINEKPFNLSYNYYY